ncbi:MAG: hypothetical protein OEO23_05005, partial [Gemmatimonadota bacterium]|nr:hypothetical protein [Gemmatimonadota bacterium]
MTPDHGLLSTARSVVRRSKRAGLAALKASGGFDASAGSFWRRQRLAILCYHGISLDDEHHWDPALFVSQDALAAR